MSQTIEISQKTYDRLQRRAVPFEDTPETVIAKLLDDSEAGGDGPPPAKGRRSANGPPAKATDTDIDIVVDDPFEPPSLKHTTVLRAEVGGQQIAKANWTTLRQAVVVIAIDECGYNLRRLLEICPMNAVDGEKSDEGYTHYPELGVSIQGQDANHAWQAAAAVARTLGVPVKVWFQWRTKSDAENPGKRGLLAID